MRKESNDGIGEVHNVGVPTFIKSVLWRVAKFLSYVEEARRLKVNAH